MSPVWITDIAPYWASSFWSPDPSNASSAPSREEVSCLHMSLGQALNPGQTWSSGSCELRPGLGKKRYVRSVNVHVHVCTHTCALCMHMWNMYVCTWDACVCMLGAGDQGGAPIITIPRAVPQEPVPCPSPAHVGEQSSFRLTAACVCCNMLYISIFYHVEME